MLAGCLEAGRALAGMLDSLAAAGRARHDGCPAPSPRGPSLFPPPPPLSRVCSDQLLTQLWAALPPGERAAVLERLAAAEGREKLPALRAQAAALAGKLRGLGA